MPDTQTDYLTLKYLLAILQGYGWGCLDCGHGGMADAIHEFHTALLGLPDEIKAGHTETAYLHWRDARNEHIHKIRDIAGHPMPQSYSINHILAQINDVFHELDEVLG